MEHEQYLTPAEAAAIVGVAPSTLARWSREGKLHPVVTLGHHRRYVRREIEQIAVRHPDVQPA